jgi:hypothetical protein
MRLFRQLPRCLSVKDAELLLKANTIIAAMTDNPNFPEPWPVQAPALSSLKDAVANF